MFDSLILYEVKARELESICLIRAELERRGYSVAFYNVMNILGKRRPRIKAKVVITPSLYCDQILRTWVYYIAGNVNKVVNLQWEQILTQEIDNDEKSMYSFQGTAKQAVHICWGEQKRKKLIRYGVPTEKAVVTGPVQMDFLREDFKSYYSSKDELFELYKMSARKKTCLFISSFSFVNQLDQILEFEKKGVGKSFDVFLNISIKSHKILIEWIDRLLTERVDVNFIYRPHPAERENNALHELAEKHENFFIIRDYSVKQWILVCDTILTWYSTSVAEIFFTNKTFEILRPVHIPVEMDVTLLKDGKMVKTYDEFFQAITIGNTDLPVKVEEMYENYDVDKNKASYIRVSDLLEQVLQTSNYDIGIDLSKVLPQFTFKEKLKYTYLYDAYLIIMQKLGMLVEEVNLPLSQSIKNKAILHNWLTKERRKNAVSANEIEAIMLKLRRIVNGK